MNADMKSTALPIDNERLAAYFQDVESFQATEKRTARRWGRVGWVVAGVSLAVNVTLAGAIVMILPLEKLVPAFITVKSDGTTSTTMNDKGPGSTSPQVTVGKKGQISVAMVSMSMVRPNVALVRFRRTVTMYGSDPQTSTWTATVGFENVATLPVSARLADPSGLIVTNYQAQKDSP
ncbi:MAG: type VI secretion protein [Acidiphilium sp. 37-67-22]|nr:MAG: type VI secretion protein [Acidiphilium sp. 37-67-22]